MRRCPSSLGGLALLGALSFGLACNQDRAPKEAPAEPAPAEPTQAPGEDPRADSAAPVIAAPDDSAPIADRGPVVATAQLPSGAQLSDLRAAVDNIQPGISAMLGDRVPTELSELVGMWLGSAKLDAPLSILVLDPTAYAEPVVMLVAVDDLAQLESDAKQRGRVVRVREGHALVGASEAVDAAESFAFTHLRDYPDHSELIVYPRQLLAAFRPGVDAILDRMLTAMRGSIGASGAEVIDSYAAALLGIVDQSDRVVVRVATSDASSALMVRLYPVPGSQLEAFVAAQTPSDHALLARLPADASLDVILSGTLRTGAARETISAWAAGLMRAVYGGSQAEAHWAAAFGAWLDAITGEFALAMDIDMSDVAAPRAAMRALLGASEAEAAHEAWRELARMVEEHRAGEGLHYEISVEQGVLEHGGVAVDRFSSTMDLSAVPAELRAAVEGNSSHSFLIAASEGALVMSSSALGEAAIAAGIDAARGEAAGLELPGELAQLVDESRGQGEALLQVLDPGRFVSAGPEGQTWPWGAVVLGLGRQGGALSLRVGVVRGQR